jgi:transcriptional regulator with PAS, ATPase and Fis domain
MKVQMGMNYGYEFLAQDIEKVSEHLESDSARVWHFNSFFKHVKGTAAKIEVDGEYLGTVFAYPYIEDSISESEVKELIDQLVECGATPADAESCVSHMKRLGASQVEYLEELADLLSDEVETYHKEISVREERIQELNSELGDKYRYHSMIGKSKKMQVIYRLLEKISSSESSVFIQGENGTGKELVAKAVHYHSPRKDNPFLAVNCSAFNDNLLDSELFGHVKGAFTGAVKDKKGLFETANGGTLFLDEIGDTSLSMQVKLLRVLQEKTFLPVGATTPKKVDVRIVAATNKNVKEMMANGEFREDLYYRINVINVDLPPLRDRFDDIPLLMDHFLKRRCDELGMPAKNFSKKCIEKMLDYPWPGNVRELENEVERLVVLAADDKMITPDLLSGRILEHDEQTGVAARGINTSGTLRQALEELEKMMIKEGLRRCNFNKSKLSKELGVSRASLIMKVDKYGLDKRKQAAGE